MRTRVLGAEHAADPCSTRHNLSRVHRLQGQLEEAERQLQQRLSASRSRWTMARWGRWRSTAPCSATCSATPRPRRARVKPWPVGQPATAATTPTWASAGTSWPMCCWVRAGSTRRKGAAGRLADRNPHPRPCKPCARETCRPTWRGCTWPPAACTRPSKAGPWHWHRKPAACRPSRWPRGSATWPRPWPGWTGRPRPGFCWRRPCGAAAASRPRGRALAKRTAASRDRTGPGPGWHARPLGWTASTAHLPRATFPALHQAAWALRGRLALHARQPGRSRKVAGPGLARGAGLARWAASGLMPIGIDLMAVLRAEHRPEQEALLLPDLQRSLRGQDEASPWRARLLALTAAK
jgi:hypothetical protein